MCPRAAGNAVRHKELTGITLFHHECTRIYRWRNMRGQVVRHLCQDLTFSWRHHFFLSLPDLAPALFTPAGLAPAAFAGPGFAPAAPAPPGLARPGPLRVALPEPLRFGVPTLPDLCARQARWMRRAAHVWRCRCMVARLSSSSAWSMARVSVCEITVSHVLPGLMLMHCHQALHERPARLQGAWM